ncbi:MAG TPA: response regulator [Candidatus Thermoplasmatota archaeon]|nr:response regulator [Candidatus Thermoplasmatota archaeon]
MLEAQDLLQGRKAGRGPPTALIVEDSGTDRRAMQAMLEGLGCRCDTSGNGEEGVLAALMGSYDIVFMDVMMPGMDGLAATQFLHGQMGANTPFIVGVSALRSEGDRRRCLEAGMDYFVSKPVHRGALQSLLGS